jgi:hypothetical protein
MGGGEEDTTPSMADDIVGGRILDEIRRDSQLQCR